MKAILIDPKARGIAEIELPPDLNVTYATLRCGVIVAAVVGDGFTGCIDGEGMFKEQQSYFSFDGKLIAGRMLLLGVAGNGGADLPSHMTVAHVQAVTRWLDGPDVSAMADAGLFEINTTGHGGTTRIPMRPSIAVSDAAPGADDGTETEADAVGIRFDINRLGDSFYGGAALRIIVDAVGTGRLLGVDVFCGDTFETISREEDVFVIAFAGDSDTVAAIAGSLPKHPAIIGVERGVGCIRNQPLVCQGFIGHQGVIGMAHDGSLLEELLFMAEAS